MRVYVCKQIAALWRKKKGEVDLRTKSPPFHLHFIITRFSRISACFVRKTTMTTTKTTTTVTMTINTIITITTNSCLIVIAAFPFLNASYRRFTCLSVYRIRIFSDQKKIHCVNCHCCITEERRPTQKSKFRSFPRETRFLSASRFPLLNFWCYPDPQPSLKKK